MPDISFPNTASAIDDLIRQASCAAGAYYASHFIIQLDLDLPDSAIRTDRGRLRFELRNLIAAVDSGGMSPTFIHEYVHYLQLTSTYGGLGHFQGICTLVDVGARVLQAAKLQGEIDPPLVRWLDASRRRNTQLQDLWSLCTNTIARVMLHEGYQSNERQGRPPPKLGEVNLGPIVVQIPASANVTPQLEEFHSCALDVLTDGQPTTHFLGSLHITEGMAYAVEAAARHDFDKRSAMRFLLEEAISFQKALQDGRETGAQIPYKLLIWFFFHTLSSADNLKHIGPHLTLDSFVVLCELSLMYHWNDRSAVDLFATLVQELAVHGSEIPPASEVGANAFAARIAQVVGLKDPMLKARETLKMLRETWLGEIGPQSGTMSAAMLNLKTNFAALFERRVRDGLFISDMLTREGIGRVVSESIDGIFLAFRNITLPVFSDETLIGRHITYVALNDQLLGLLLQRSKPCILEDREHWRFCQYWREGNPCSSAWPGQGWPSSHPCPRIQHTNELHRICARPTGH